jgi:iron complex outermembrane receptor protein
MSASRFILILMCAASPSVAAMITGTVKDSHSRPIHDVNVAVGNMRTVTTDASGRFTADVPDGSYVVRFTHPNFRSERREMKAGDSIDIALIAAAAETIVVSGIRAEADIPVTKTTIDRQQIAREYHQQDIPLLLRSAPSVNAWAESGTGASGYSYITLRGVSSTRINFTLDGVPLADSEDFGTYFADFPDLAHSLESIQIQRGVGTSTVGSPSFGGSVNLESVRLTQDAETHARVAGGSFGTRFATLGYQTGALPGGFAAYTRVSYNESDGFRDSSASRQHNIFVSAARRGDSSELRLTGFTAHETQQLSFYAADADTLRHHLRANPLTPEETDSFGYDLALLQYLRPLGERLDLTAAAYYQRGYGWYRLYDYGTTDLRQYGLDGMLLGTMLNLSHRAGPFTTNYGFHVNRFEREHTRDLVAGSRDYFNYGVKGEANAFAKVSYDRGPWLFYGDAQLRYSQFEYHGDVEIDPISWTFFNPRIGARRTVSARSSVYASAGLSTREPTRNDMFLGEDNASIPHDLRAVRPERLFDVEAGYELRTPNVTLQANLYAMEFRNEIALTGELSEIGLPLRRNVDRSYRRGLEVDAAWQVNPALRVRSIANLGRNEIREWTPAHRNVEPLLTPSIILNQAIEYSPSSSVSTGAIARYVSRAFLDNTNDLAAPSFLTVDGNVSVAVSKRSRLSLQINNLFDNDEVFPSGYAIDGTAYYFPQATRNFALMLDVRL